MLPNTYWNLDEILMSTEKINCKLLRNLPALDLLTPQNSIGHTSYKADEVVPLPLTIAVAYSLKEIILVEKPAYLQEQYYNILQADPTISDLSGKNRYFYEKCNLIMPLLPKITEEEKNENDKWIKCLVRTVFLRFLYYYKNSQNVQIINTTIQRKSSNTEIKFFEKMVKLNNNIKFFKENYSNNNKVLDEKIEAKKMRLKMKKNQY